MSNFICPECGMTNIDCGYAGYKTPREIELGKENKRLQEQLKEAEIALRFYDRKDFHYEVDGVVMGAEPAHKYFVKWGVK